MVYANKQDIPGALSLDEIADVRPSLPLDVPLRL